MTTFDNSRFNSASYLGLKSDQCSSTVSPGLDPPLKVLLYSYQVHFSVFALFL